MRARSFFPFLFQFYRVGLLLILILAIPIAYFLFHRLQEIRQHASIPAIAPTKAPANGEGTIHWIVNYETGDLSQWSEVHTGGTWGNSSVEVVTSPVRNSKYAAKFTVNAGGGGVSQRAEVSATQQQTGGYPGQEWYYSWSVLVPSVPNATTGWAEWTLITQWMDLLYQCSPPLQVDIEPGPPLHYTLNSTLLDNKNGCAPLGPSREWDLGQLQYNKWDDFTIRIKWSDDPSVGFVEMWRNGVKVVSLTHVRTLDTSGGVYMEQDLYRPSLSGTNVIYFEDTRRHDSFNLSSS